MLKLTEMGVRSSPTRVCSWARRDSGIMLVEVLIALFIFAIVATGLVNVVVSSTSASTRVKQQTLAEQGVMNQIEKIRSMDYNAVGTVNGCVPGTLNASVPFTGLNGENLGVLAHLNTNVAYASADVPGSAQTGADYKKITVSVTRDTDGRVLAQATTNLAPKNEPSQTTATIKATVSDYGAAGTPLQGVPVNLATGPSAPESCLTDASGSVTFPGLTPTPTSGSQAYYDLSVTPPPGYQVLSDDASGKPPVHVQLSPTQFWSTSLSVFKPATIVVNLLNPDGSSYTGPASVTVTSLDARTSGISKTFSYSGGSLTVTNVVPADSPYLVPGQYSLQVSQPGYVAVSDTATVPAGYPTILTTTFNEWMVPQGELDVTVQEKYSGSWITCSNTSATLTGGPDGVNFSGTGSPVKFPGLTPGGPAATPSPPLSQTPFTVTVGSTVVNNVTVNPGPGATTLTVQAGNTNTSSC